MGKDKRRQEDKVGWFARLSRKVLEAEWKGHAEKHGQILRYDARSDAWDRIVRGSMVPLDKLLSLANELFEKNEQQILGANQAMFSQAVRDAKRQIMAQELEPKLPFLSEDEAARERVEEILADNFEKVKGKYLRDPATNYTELKLSDDVDFIGMYAMTQVRDEQTHRMALSTESYEYAEKVRHALSLPENTRIKDIVEKGRRDDREAS